MTCLAWLAGLLGHLTGAFLAAMHERRDRATFVAGQTWLVDGLGLVVITEAVPDRGVVLRDGRDGTLAAFVRYQPQGGGPEYTANTDEFRRVARRPGLHDLGGT